MPRTDIGGNANQGYRLLGHTASSIFRETGSAPEKTGACIPQDDAFPQAGQRIASARSHSTDIGTDLIVMGLPFSHPRDAIGQTAPCKLAAA